MAPGQGKSTKSIQYLLKVIKLIKFAVFLLDITRGTHRTYDGSKIDDLLRAIRNYGEHDRGKFEIFARLFPKVQVVR